MRYLTLVPLWFIDVFFSFQGRIDREQFAVRHFVYSIIGVLLFAAVSSRLSLLQAYIAFSAVAIGYCVNAASLVTRRLHDHDVTGKEAWKILSWFSDSRGRQLLELTCEANTSKVNRYGQRPNGVLSMNPERKRHHLSGSCP